jgi:nucleoside 2-deoxyribosyltransferase
MKVYLAGPINGRSDYSCRAWREAAKKMRPEIEWLDPMDRDYRGIEDQNVEQIVAGDMADIASADVVLVCADDGASWGTAMEVRAAKHELGKRVIAFQWRDSVSPWLRYHTDAIYKSVSEAVAAL